MKYLNLSFLALLLPVASFAACLDSTWDFRTAAATQSKQSPDLDRRAATYQCQVVGSRPNQEGLYLRYVELLTQGQYSYDLPWSSATSQIFTLLDHAYYVTGDAKADLESFVSCIDRLKNDFSVGAENGAYDCFESIYAGKASALNACLAGSHPHNETEGRAAVYSCFNKIL